MLGLRCRKPSLSSGTTAGAAVQAAGITQYFFGAVTFSGLFPELHGIRQLYTVMVLGAVGAAVVELLLLGTFTLQREARPGIEGRI